MLWLVTCEFPEGEIGAFYVDSEEYPNPTEGMLVVGEVRTLASVKFDSPVAFKAGPTVKYWVWQAQSQLISESEYKKLCEEW